MGLSVLILNWRCPKNPLLGGAEKVTLKHASAWVKKGIKVTWIAGNYAKGNKKETIDCVKIFRFGNPITIYFLAPFLYWFMFKARFDVVIDEIHGVPFLTPLWAWKSKKLAYIHEVAQEIWDEMLPFPINILGKIYEKIYFFIYRNTPFLTGSNSTKQDLIRYGVPSQNITVIPHGLFITPVTVLPKKEQPLTLLFVSRLVKMKGIEEAIGIFAQVRNNVPTAQFWIVGGGNQDYVQRLKNMVHQQRLEKNITFFGFVSEKQKIKLYQKAHFLLHTSVREGFGLVVIEANSQGTPVLAYDSPGLRDVVQNGINGFVYSKDKNTEMAKKCVSLFNSKAYPLLAQSSIVASKKYNWDTITQQSFTLL